jgi:hypothetical protein
MLDGDWWVGVALGLIAVVMATLGDLCESVIKRDLGIKDMSQVIPGHGGLMDRLDSLLATSPRSGCCCTTPCSETLSGDNKPVRRGAPARGTRRPNRRARSRGWAVAVGIGSAWWATFVWMLIVFVVALSMDNDTKRLPDWLVFALFVLPLPVSILLLCVRRTRQARPASSWAWPSAPS